MNIYRLILTFFKWAWQLKKNHNIGLVSPKPWPPVNGLVEQGHNPSRSVVHQWKSMFFRHDNTSCAHVQTSIAWLKATGAALFAHRRMAHNQGLKMRCMCWRSEGMPPSHFENSKSLRHPFSVDQSVKTSHDCWRARLWCQVDQWHERFGSIARPCRCNTG